MSRESPWVLAGVWIDHVAFQPVSPGIEPITQRLPESGLLSWADLPSVIAPSQAAAGEAALLLARRAFPATVRNPVPFATG